MSAHRSENAYDKISSTTPSEETTEDDQLLIISEVSCKWKFIIFLELLAVLACLSVCVVLPIFFRKDSTIFTEFPMSEDANTGFAIVVVTEVFLGILVVGCLADFVRRIRKADCSRFKNGNIQYETLPDTSASNGRKLPSFFRRIRGPNRKSKRNKRSDAQGTESVANTDRKFPSFFLRQMMQEMSNVALMEVGLLAQNTAEEARRRRLYGQEKLINYSLVSFSEYVHGISIADDKTDVSCYSLRATVVIAGSPCVGKTSIFSRILYDKYDSQVVPTLGIDYGLKTLKVSGKNMFGKPISMDVGMHIWDTSGDDTMKGLSLAYFRDHVVLIVVCDVMDSTSLHGLVWWVSSMKSKVSNPYIAVFLNKIDLEDRSLTPEDLTGIPALQGAGIYEVSAKYGDGILESFTQVICHAICDEAKEIVESATVAQSNARLYHI